MNENYMIKIDIFKYRVRREKIMDELKEFLFIVNEEDNPTINGNIVSWNDHLIRDKHYQDVLINLIVRMCRRSKIEKRTSLNAMDIYYGIKYFDLNIGDLKTLCKEVENRVATQENIEKNETHVKSVDEYAEDQILAYTDMAFFDINESLRGEKHPKKDTIPGGGDYDIDQIIETIDNAPQNDRDFYVFRKTDDFDFDNGKTLNDLRLDDTFLDQAFTSASWRPSYVAREDGNFILMIKIPENLKVIFVEPLGKLGEAEVLTYPGMEFRITDVSIRHLYSYKVKRLMSVKVYTLEIIGNFWNSKWIPNKN